MYLLKYIKDVGKDGWIVEMVLEPSVPGAGCGGFTDGQRVDTVDAAAVHCPQPGSLRYGPAINLSLQPPLDWHVYAALAQLHPFAPLCNSYILQ